MRDLCYNQDMKILAKKLFWFCLCFVCFCASSFFSVTAFAQNGSIDATYYLDSDVPIILPRSTWDNGPSLNALMTWLPQNVDFPSDWQPIERIVLHDTGCNTDSNPVCNNNIDPISTIQAIYRYHAVTRGWGDIGYNYIIDQQGRIYEGRYGGNGSRGAHTYYDRASDNFNFGSIGIAILGNYTNAKPSDAVYKSLARLVGWLGALNGLDPAGQHSSFIWNATKGGFKTLYSGPVVVGHKDLEPGNPDPGLLDLAKVRSEAAVLAAKFKDYIYQKNDGSAKIYKITLGSRQTFEDLVEFGAQGNSYAKLVSLSSGQLDLFSETRFLKYPDGSLISLAVSPTIYLIDNGKKRAFNITAKQFSKMGFDFAAVKQVTPDELIKYADGPEIKYGPDKQLISDGAKVYLVENGKKRWVTSNSLFSVLGFKWSKVKNISSADAVTFLDGDAMLYPDGTLLRAKDSPTVYLMKNGAKHQFVSAQSFLQLGFKWGSVTTVQADEIALAPSNSFVPYKDGTLIRPQGSQTIFLVSRGMARQFVSQEIFSNLKYKASLVLDVSAEEFSFYSQGEPVKYAEGTLLRPKNSTTVYLISGVKAQAIDAATFKKKNYKWANVLVIADQDFAVLYGGASLATLALPVASSSVSATTTIQNIPSSLSASSSGSVLAGVPKIRIAIFEVTDPSVSFSASSAFDVFDKNGQGIASKKAGEIFVYKIGAPENAFAKIVPTSPDGIVEITSFEDHPAWKPTLNYNKFRGAIEIVFSDKSNKILAVNELGLEDYLKGVAEAGQDDPAQYQKAIIVAARTYADYYILKGGKRGVDEVYHLNNTSNDQLYKGYVRETIAGAIVDAVNLTRGEIVSYNNQPIVAAYSSGAAELQSTGTKSACLVWGDKYCQAGFEYLAGGVKDPAGTEYNYSSCTGANHCVGLSGAGTRQFAKTGAKNYQEILKYYYPGTAIQKIY